MPQNYRVLCSNFGSYVKGDVIPEHEVATGHDVNTLVTARAIEPTHLPISVELKPRAERPQAPSENLLDERNRLFNENARLAQDLQAALAQGAAIARQRDDLKGAVADATLEVEHLKRACEEHQTENDRLRAEIAKLTAELDAATAPV